MPLDLSLLPCESCRRPLHHLSGSSTALVLLDRSP
ncbi:MAG TPA: hypothetical protein H9811_08900 [Candidatus Gemmiger excrementigallinarum]|uniref:Uncharacterized protein n=1 Tax=Candidatus Gemmiger excrementigallinarum TaxID=2838609 RepID=A0A9D2ERL5_9FIRM|nr:hypothetical protein [Candidatus Gemmiger excrementigallinarum]